MAEKQSDANVNGYLAAIIVLAIAMSFAYFRFIQPQAVQVNGLTLYARSPAGDLKRALGEGRLILREELFPGSDGRNAVVGALGAEIAASYSTHNRVLSIYGHIDGLPDEQAWVNCGNDTDNCRNEKIVVRLDSCNCLKIEGGKMYVLFDEEAAKAADTRVKLGGVINGVLGAAVLVVVVLWLVDYLRHRPPRRPMPAGPPSGAAPPPAPPEVPPPAPPAAFRPVADPSAPSPPAPGTEEGGATHA